MMGEADPALLLEQAQSLQGPGGGVRSQVQRWALASCQSQQESAWKGDAREVQHLPPVHPQALAVGSVVEEAHLSGKARGPGAHRLLDLVGMVVAGEDSDAAYPHREHLCHEIDLGVTDTRVEPESQRARGDAERLVRAAQDDLVGEIVCAQPTQQRADVIGHVRFLSWAT